VDGYVLHERLGAGAQAEVWRGEAVGRPGRVLAVKRFAAGAARDTVAQVRREAEALERLSHPSIVRLLDVPADDDGAALVTPYLPGGTLADRIARGPLPPAAVADLGARLGDALSAAHGAGVVHADVKPANVLYDAEEQPLLTDFGAAHLQGRRDDVHGTATYLAPEVADGTTAPTPGSDQYALGVTLYEALAGVPPYAAPTVAATLRAAARGVHLPLADLAEDVPAEAAAAIERAFARDPAARWPSVRDLASRLEEVRTSLPSWTLPPSTSPVTAVPPPPTGPATAATPLTAPRSTPPPAPPGLASSPGSRPAAEEGASAADPRLTRRFGPAPPPTTTAAKERATRRTPLLIAAAAVVLVPLAVVLALLLSDRDDDGGIVAAPTASPAPDTTPVQLPRCEDAPRLPPDTAEVVPADTEGRGCTLDLGWDPEDRVLTVPRVADDPLRFELGEPGDRLLVGDWNCDGRQSPGLYRPSTGEVFTFDGFAGEGGTLDSGPARRTGMRDGEPLVVAGDGAGVCDRIEVRGDA
jgi:eukaryotic-like serine/threonine-protein kinase